MTITILSLTAILLGSCNFPYQPQQFVLPDIPSFFISADSVMAFTKSSKVKVAYTLNEGSRVVYFIDFSQTSPSPVRLKKAVGKETLSGDSPLISPDGTFVTYYLTHGADLQGAYIQRLDGAAAPVLVAANATEPHWWTDSAGQLYVLYSDQLMSVLSASLTPNQNATYRQKVSLTGDGSLIGAAEKIAPYAMNGGMSKNGRYLCTGYQNAAFYDLTNNLLIPINSGIQTCNPSIDPDAAHPDVMMFLNIKGTQNLTNPFLGNADFPFPQLTEHQMIFIVNSANMVVDYIPLTLATARYATSYIEWQDPEWSNDPHYSMALAVINDADADGMIIKNVGDHQTAKELLRITPEKFKLNPTSTPYIWIGE